MSGFSQYSEMLRAHQGGYDNGKQEGRKKALDAVYKILLRNFGKEFSDRFMQAVYIEERGRP